MGTIRPGIRGGLLELFYAVYERDSSKCLDALVTMGVLVPTGDLTAVRRTAKFFLDSFDQRLAAQKAERAAVGEQAYSAEYKAQRTKEEKGSRRKQILSSIGEDLLAVSKDQPFRFPATFTFVVRAFSVLDGIGKGLGAPEESGLCLALALNDTFNAALIPSFLLTSPEPRPAVRHLRDRAPLRTGAAAGGAGVCAATPGRVRPAGPGAPRGRPGARRDQRVQGARPHRGVGRGAGQAGGWVVQAARAQPGG